MIFLHVIKQNDAYSTQQLALVVLFSKSRVIKKVIDHWKLVLRTRFCYNVMELQKMKYSIEPHQVSVGEF